MFDSGHTRLLLSREVERLEEAIPLSREGMDNLPLWQVRPGEILTVCSGQGHLFRARLQGDGKQVIPFESLPPSIEPPLPRLLCQGFPDKERMLLVIEKGVELGATAIVPLLSEKGNLPQERPAGQDKSAIWGKVARRAARQCRRPVLPQVVPPMALDPLLAQVPGHYTRLVMDWPQGEVPAPQEWKSLACTPLIILVGPEGGWSHRERARFVEEGARFVRLGGRLLRTETAGLAILSLLAAMDTV